MLMLRKKIQISSPTSLVLLALVLCLSGRADGVCVSIPITTSEVKGRVQTEKDEAIPHATIELWVRKGKEDQGTLIRQVIAADDGLFRIIGVKKGKYLLIVKSKYFADLWQPIRVKSTNKNKGKQLVVLLDPILGQVDPCSEAILR